MRTTLILATAAFAAFSGAAFAQSSPAQPVMPAQREYTNPNADIQPPSSSVAPVPEGRAAAPMEHTAPNGNMKAKERSGANGS